ncbi:hypothetical protein MOQ_002345 [Trypanosoma cruzi marinkellei]|uniref:Membrane protein YIP1 n=1 Tax=Trypanosoma cruzi marinkellei TaxID=85056 RepID=K2NC24_TRYCR|nr:hypothetical protein MOQ_002345 [Trypanosoma cruzi marinkellei]
MHYSQQPPPYQHQHNPLSPSMPLPLHQPYQTQPNGFFYQPYTNGVDFGGGGGGGGGGNVYADPAGMPARVQSGYNTHITSSQFFNGEENSQKTHESQQSSHAHVMSIGVVTPTTSRRDSCVSPKAFGRMSATSSTNNSPSLGHYATRKESPLPPVASKPFLQQPNSFSVTMMASPAPAFHESALHANQPFNQSQPHQQHQQQPYQQPSSAGVPPSQSTRTGFVASLLNVILPHDAFASSTQQESIPLYQQRFGYPEDDLPLLEELGIFPHQIRCKALAVLNPFRAMALEAVEDMDLAGPIVFAITLAFLLSLRGKLEFSTIYGHSVLGIVFMKFLLSLMTDHGVALQFVISALGYCLIPNVILAIFQSFAYWLFGYIGKTMLPPALLIVLWSAWCATAMFVSGLSMEKQRYLILYPMFLFYAVFAALTIF